MTQEEYPEVSKDYCWSCDKDEPLPPTGGVYHVCLECGHIYHTEQDLVSTLKLNVGYDLTADEINACPLCSHDF